MTARKLATFAMWSAVLGAGIGGAFAGGYVAGESHHRLDFQFANRIDRDNACLARAESGARETTSFPKSYGSIGFYRLTQVVLEEQYCLQREDYAFVSAGDVYDIAGVRLHLEFPGPNDPVWQRPDVPRKPQPYAYSGIRPADRTWSSTIRGR